MTWRLVFLRAANQGPSGHSDLLKIKEGKISGSIFMSELKTLSWTDDHVQQHEPSFEHVRKQTNLAIWINYLPILFKNQYTFVNKNAESKKNKLRFNFVEFWMRQCTGGKNLIFDHSSGEKRSNKHENTFLRLCHL